MSDPYEGLSAKLGSYDLVPLDPKLPFQILLNGLWWSLPEDSFAPALEAGLIKIEEI